MRKKVLSLFTMALAISGISFGQSNIDLQNVRPGESVEYCKEHKLFEQLMQDPEYKKAYEKDQATYAMEAQKNGNSIQAKGVVYRIPIVFHVLHNNGPENISREQIVDALNILNRDYRRLNLDADFVHPDFQSMPTDVEIEFVMATKAPNGACFSGITRTQSIATYNGGNGNAQVTAIRNGNDVFQGEWPGNKYLNVFICADIGGAAGYTYRPNSAFPGSQMRNGIWVLHDYVGSIGTGSVGKSRTLTHECGHWLNLPHTWGSTNNPGLASNCNTDDGIADTPNTIGVSACNLNENSCGPRANVENYMDYSYCSKMYTPGQATTQRTAITSSVAGRNNLITAANLAATGADSNFTLCKAEFTADDRVICVGGTVNFSDESYNTVNGWNWTFPGGSPSSSTSPNPSVTYNTPGLYEVTLVASDGGTNQTTTKTNYIRVLPAGINLNYSESFENYTSLSSANSFFTPVSPNASTWEVYTGAGSTGNKSLRIRNFNNPAGQRDELISGNFDLSGLTAANQVTLSFKFAYKRKSSSNNEILRVSASANCGETFLVRKTLSNTTLGTDVLSSEFVPTAGDWQQVHVVNITSQYFTSNMQVEFEFESDGGNNIYIDDINFYNGDENSLGLSENANISAVSLYPNPADDMVNMSFDLLNKGKVVFEITDITGKVIQTHQIEGAEGGNLVMINTDEFSQGAYVIRLNAGGKLQNLRFMVK